MQKIEAVTTVRTPNASLKIVSSAPAEPSGLSAIGGNAQVKIVADQLHLDAWNDTVELRTVGDSISLWVSGLRYEGYGTTLDNSQVRALHDWLTNFLRSLE